MNLHSFAIGITLLVPLTIDGSAPAKSGDVSEFDALLQRSESFEKKIKIPTHDNKIAVIAGTDKAKQEKIVEQAKNTYPLMHKKTAELIDDFLAYKKKYGSAVEKALYANMDKAALLDRLLAKRPIVFETSVDIYLLRDGKTKGQGGFQDIGSEKEKAPLLLKDYLSYDEMQLSALLGVSVPTYFINDGSRNNNGVKAADGSYEPEGVLIGLVGARFEIPGLMESQYMLITAAQNTAAKGYGIKGDNKKDTPIAMWSKAYELEFPTFEEADQEYMQAQNKTTSRYMRIGMGLPKTYFDKAAYKERMRLVIEPFLLDAHAR